MDIPRAIIPRDFTNLTPSGFHDEKWRQNRALPTHDEMQRDFLTFLRARSIIVSGALVTREVIPEYEFVRKGRIVAFADAVEIVDVDFMRTVNIYEIKPIIETVFGIVRQCKALFQLARELIPGNVQVVHAVVPFNDPLLDALRVEWPAAWGWGATFKPVTEDDC